MLSKFSLPKAIAGGGIPPDDLLVCGYPKLRRESAALSATTNFSPVISPVKLSASAYFYVLGQSPAIFKLL